MHVYKNGSELTSTEYTAINPIIQDPLAYFDFNNNDSKVDENIINSCFELVNEYIQNNIEHLNKKNKTNELDDVQPFSLKLIQNLCRIILPKYVRYLSFGGKGFDSSISYSTDIITSNQLLTIKGKTDESILYKGICIFAWEDKNILQNLDKVKHKTQVLMEIKGFSELFKKSVSVEPKTFIGILTNGTSWIFAVREFMDGMGRYILLDQISAKEEKENINIISKMIVYCLINCKKSIDLIDQNLNKMKMNYDYSDINDFNDDADGDNNDDNDDDNDNFRKGNDHMKKLTQSIKGVSISKKKSETKSKNVTGKKVVNSNARKVLGELDINIITNENIILHNKYTCMKYENF
jgi:hypothetical protein